MADVLFELDKEVENRLREINGEIVLEAERCCGFDICEFSKIIKEQSILKDFLYYKDSKQYFDFNVRCAYKKRLRETYYELKKEIKPCGFCRLCFNIKEN